MSATHPNIVETIKEAIRRNVVEADKDSVDLTDRAFEETKARHFQMPAGGEVKVTDYFPSVFRRIRESVGIESQDFLLSWVPGTDELKKTEGRSGSLFYKTPDGKYFFKTILKQEILAMKSMIREYYQHLQTQNNSMVMRMLAMFEVKMPGLFAPSYRVLVMKNIFPLGVAINEKYDLKGRKPKRDESKERILSPGVLQKDNTLARKFYVADPAAFQTYLEQVKKDVDFLRKVGMLDYSLLIGVHYNKEDVSSPTVPDEKPRKKKRTVGGKKKTGTLKKKAAVAAANGVNGVNGETKRKSKLPMELEETKTPTKANNKTQDEDEEETPVRAKRQSLKKQAAPVQEQDDDSETATPVRAKRQSLKKQVAPVEEEENGKKSPATKRKSLPKKSLETEESEEKPVSVSRRASKRKIDGTPESNGKEEVDTTSPATGKNLTKRKSARLSKIIKKPANPFFSGVPGVNPKTGAPETYFIGIIDCLTDFHVGKLAANTFKRVLWDQEMLSTVRPAYYASRFAYFCSKTIWAKDESDNSDMVYIELNSP